MIESTVSCNHWLSLVNDASGDVRRLDDVVRFSSIPVVFRETVSMHSFWVAMYSYMIHEKLQGPKSLTAPVLVHALSHDIVECLSGDFVRTFKYLTEELKNQIEIAEGIALESLPKSISSMTKFNDLSTDEIDYVKKVVKSADFLSLFEYMVREKRRGNEEFAPFYRRMILDLKNYSHELAKSERELDKSLSNLYLCMVSPNLKF